MIDIILNYLKKHEKFKLKKQDSYFYPFIYSKLNK